MHRSLGCSTSEELSWKLEALQAFISDLHWPDEVFAKHLEQRLKMMACDMLESSLNRTLQSFQNWEKRGSRFGTNVTDYIVPSEMCVMVNVVLETRNQSLKLCTFDGVDVVSSHSYSNPHLLIALTSSGSLILSFLHFHPTFFKTHHMSISPSSSSSSSLHIPSFFIFLFSSCSISLHLLPLFILRLFSLIPVIFT